MSTERAAQRRAFRSAQKGALIRIGWVERVSLPSLGLELLPAKVDTGARTSALHVAALRPLSRARAGAARELDVVLPRVGRGRAGRVVRVTVADWLEVRDTSGRRERRPVIETLLELGPLRRVVRITLTDRGGMRYAMLVGRSALGRGVVVDPAARFVMS
jgi:hypothetical protein